MKWVALAGVAGGVGLAAVAVPSFMVWLCENFGCHFAGMFVWFFLTDVSMWCLYKYWMTRVTDPKMAALMAEPEARNFELEIPLMASMEEGPGYFVVTEPGDFQ